MRRVVLVGLVASMMLLAGCASIEGKRSVPPTAKGGGPPPWAPAHGLRAKHAYYYYPSVGVYFDLSTRSYFYLSGGVWTVSTNLPPTIVLDSDHVRVELDTDRPYLYYDEHKARFAGKKPKKGKGQGRPF